MEHCVAQLRSAGWIEAERVPGRFYREMTPLTAFVVNIKQTEQGIALVYGCSSTAQAKADGCEHLIRYGLDHDVITVRRGLSVADMDALAAHESVIRDFYAQYAGMEKDELLAAAKELRKEFIALFTARLKPQGFRKQSNTWRKILENGHAVCFYLQKSAYSDAYYYNIYMERGDSAAWNRCYETRVAPHNADNNPHDWQLTPRAEMEAFIDEAVLGELSRLIETPLPTLGRDPATWRHCLCQRNRCADCWVEKNLWESRTEERKEIY